MTNAAIDTQPPLLTTAELVAQLREDGVGDITLDAVYQWLRDPLPPPVAAPGRQGQSHKWDYDQVLDWMAARAARPRAKGWTPPGTIEAIDNPRAEKLRHEARIAKLNADEREGLLVPAEQIEAAMGRVIDATRTAALALPHVLTDRLGLTDQQRDVVHAEVLAVLERLARGVTDDEDA